MKKWEAKLIALQRAAQVLIAELNDGNSIKWPKSNILSARDHIRISSEYLDIIEKLRTQHDKMSAKYRKE